MLMKHFYPNPPSTFTKKYLAPGKMRRLTTSVLPIVTSRPFFRNYLTRKTPILQLFSAVKLSAGNIVTYYYYFF